MRYPEPKLFKPKNPQKYAGDANNVIARSGIELRYFKYLDEHPDIVSWASEEMHVKYISPVDNKEHRYFVDLLAKTKNGKVYAIEIKPYSQCQPPKQGKNKKRYLEESITYAVNQAKWAAATEYFKSRGAQFLVLTEREIQNKW